MEVPSEVQNIEKHKDWIKCSKMYRKGAASEDDSCINGKLYPQACLLLFIRPSKTFGKSVNLLTDDCCISGNPKLKLHSDPILISNPTCHRKVIF